jgi:ribonuclease P protein component
MSLTFRKRERMVSRKLIEMLFNGNSSHSMAAFPLRAVYAATERNKGDVAVQLLISVPKKRFRHAVDRNRVKRQVREAFRRHKQVLYDAMPANRQLLLALVWLTDTHMASAEIEVRLASLVQRIAEKVKKYEPEDE